MTRDQTDESRQHRMFGDYGNGLPQKKCCENLNFTDEMPIKRGKSVIGVSDLICQLFAHDPLRVFIATYSRKARMPQVPVRRPCLKISAPREAAVATAVSAVHLG